MKEKGMTLVELLVAMTIFVLAGIAFTAVLVFHQKSFVRQNKRILLKSQMRTGLLELTDKILSAGSGVAVACNQSYMGSGTVQGLTQGTCSFRGIIPLNTPDDAGGNENGPDGIILAYGNTSTITRFAPSQSSWTPSTFSLSLEKFYDTSKVPPTAFWYPGDIGMVMSSDGFYVFQVQQVDNTTQTLYLRDTPVYYSGLLNFNHSGTISIAYKDLLPEVVNYSSTKYGNSITYFRNTSVVIKLDFFGIYFIDKIGDDYYLVASFDTQGAADPCQNGYAPQRCVPLAKNIVDLQLEYYYIDKPSNPTEKKVLCSSGEDIPSDYDFEETPNFRDLYGAIINKQTTAIRISMAGVTEEFTKKYQEHNYLEIPALGDRGVIQLSGEPWVNMKLEISKIIISPRNMFTVY